MGLPLPPRLAGTLSPTRPPPRPMPMPRDRLCLGSAPKAERVSRESPPHMLRPIPPTPIASVMPVVVGVVVSALRLTPFFYRKDDENKLNCMLAFKLGYAAYEN